jgi:hypothetical protein
MERLGEDVSRQLDRLGPQAGVAKIAERWPGAVGEAIARNAWPARIQRDGTLLVHTSSSTWAFELTHLEGSVREGLGELAPPCLRFVPGPLPEPDQALPAETTATAPRVGASEERRAASLAAAIADESLRKLVARAAAASLARARSDRDF